MSAKLHAIPALAILVLMLIAPQVTRAQTRGLSLRGSLNLALMVSSDQVRRLAYDAPGVVGALYGGYALARMVEVRAGVIGGAYFSRLPTGGLLAGCVGARLLAPSRRVEPYAAFDVGVAATGELVRPWLALSVGVDVALTEQFTLGPTLAYHRLAQWNGPHYSTDASSFAFGASLVYSFDRPAPRAPTPPPRKLPPSARMPRSPKPEPAPEPSPDVLALIERALPFPATRVELLAPVLFGFDSDALEPVGTAMLHEVAHTLRARPQIELVEVRGYADARGSAAYNQALAQRRAERVRDWLVEHGVEQTRLLVASHGASGLVEQSSEESSQAQNRRVVFRILREVAE